MKSPEKSGKAEPARQKKQLLALGGLSAVFLAVLAVQFSGGKAAPPAAAMAEPAPAPSGEVAEAGGSSPDAAASGTPIPVAKDNPVLAQPAAETAVKRSPFSNFWNVTPTTTRSTAPSLSAPSITLNATMPSEIRGLAVIDGTLRFVGDSVQGWFLETVGPRSVTLRAPSGESVAVDMPLLVGRLILPADMHPAGSTESPDTAPSGG